MLATRFRSAGVLIGLLLLSGCGGGDGGTGPVPTPTVRSVSVTPSAATLRVGETQSLSAVVDAINGAGTGVTWISESPSIATVNGSGVVTAVAVGSAVIRATSTSDTKVSGAAVLTIQSARNITVTPSTASIGTGQTVTLAAAVQIDAGLPTTVTWRTSAAGVATVSATGVVTGVTIGTAQITAVSTADTTLRASATISIVPVVRAVAVTPTTASVFLAATQQLTATVTADVGAAQTLTWRSSNAAVASVSASGLVTGVSVGTATITVLSTADTTRRATAAITVASRPLSVSIAERAVNVNPGSTTTLTAVVLADPGVNTAVTWSSASGSVATISQLGVVTGVAQGTSLITATSVADPSRRDTVTVRVVPRLAGTWTASRLGGPLYEDIVSVASIDASTTYVVNSLGDVYRWNGTTWSLSTTGNAFGTAFYAVHASGTGNVIAVGAGGVIARWNGTGWAAMTSGTTRGLYAVWVESSTSAWAVGDNGIVLHLTNSSWAVENAGSTQVLNAVWAGDNVVYAVGANGEVLRRLAASWSRVTVPSAEGLYGVHGLSANDLVVVGGQGTVLRFNGITWTTINAGGFLGSFYAVTGSAANNGRRVLVGDGGVAQLDGSAVTLVTTPYAPRLYSVSMDAGGDVYAGGQRGAVLRSGTPWTTLNLVPDLLDVWTTSATNAFAVGEFGFIYRWNGTAWARQTTPTTATLNTVWAASATDAFAGGDNGTMLRFNGTGWTPMTLPTSSSVYALWGSSASNVFAATVEGEVLRFNGTSWSTSTTTTSGLWAVYGISPTDVLVSGENGLFLRFNGTTWTTVTPPTSGTLAGLWMTGLTNVYTVGANGSGTGGIAYSYNGTTFSPLQVGSSRILTSVWGPSIQELYATGDVGTLLRFNGTTWSAINTGTSDLLWSVSGAPDASGGAFAVGYNSTVIAGSNGSPLRAGVRVGNGSLEPGVGARLLRGPLPTGAARAHRQRR
jgi:uncharacterized protein YjdB